MLASAFDCNLRCVAGEVKCESSDEVTETAEKKQCLAVD